MSSEAARIRPAIPFLFTAALLIRLVVQIAYGSYSRPETWEYDMMAKSLLAGEGYHYPFYESDWLTFGFPAFPFLLALLHWLGGGPDAYWLILLVLAVASSALVPLGHRMASLLHPSAGITAAVLLAIDPVLVLFSARVHELNLDALVLAAILVLALEEARGTARRPLLLGLAVGISSLARPTIFVFGVVALAILAIRRPRRSLAFAAILAAAVAAPWAMRTAVVLGGATATNPYNCVTLWMGNNPDATGGPLTGDGRSVFAVMSDDLRARIVSRTEVEQGRVFCDEAFAFLRADPSRTALWVTQKLAYFWWFPPHAGIFYPRGWLEAYQPVYAAELALVVAGIVLSWRRGPRAGVLLVLAQLAVVSLAQSVGYVEGRHRLVLEPTLLSLAAVSLTALSSGVRPILWAQARRYIGGSTRA